MIFHLLLNTFLVFLALALLIEGGLSVFRIKNKRLRVFCRLLPFIKLPFDFLIFAFHGTSFFFNINPFSCEFFVKEMLEGLIHFPSNSNFFLPEYVGMLIPPAFFTFFTAFVIAITSLMAIKKSVQFLVAWKHLKKIIRESTPCTRQITNLYLRESLQGTKILVSSEIAVPQASLTNVILMPAAFDLPQEEFEAVIAHELEHLRWRDPLLKMVCQTVAQIVWWIPTRWWMKRLESDQEGASDASVHKYNIHSESLASAIVKVASHKTRSHLMTCHFAANRTIAFKRAKEILLPPQQFFLLPHVCGASFCILVFVSFWMC